MDVAIIGIGIHPFGRTEGVTGLEQGAHAVNAALKDAGIGWNDIQFAYGGSTDAGAADTLVSKLGQTGLQFINVANGCATGGSALISAYTAISSGAWEIGVAVGFDKHPRGAFAIDPESMGLGKWYGDVGLSLTTQFFGMKIQKYMYDYGITEDSLIRVAVKNFRNGSLNPNAWRKKALSYEDIANSAMIANPLRQYMFCSPGEGAAALVLCSAKKAKRYTRDPIYLKAAVVKTRLYGSFEVFSPSLSAKLAPSPSVQASQAAYEMAGVGPKDIDVAEVHDCFTIAEMMAYENLGFAQQGEGKELIRAKETYKDGSIPVNVDGGLLSKGHPIGATGGSQIRTIVLQLRDEAGDIQVKDPKIGLVHNIGGVGLYGNVTILGR